MQPQPRSTYRVARHREPQLIGEIIMQSFQEAMLGKFESICDSAKLTAIVMPEWTNTGIVLAQDRNNGGWRTVMKLHYDFQSTVSTVRLNGGTGPTDRENVF